MLEKVNSYNTINKSKFTKTHIVSSTLARQSIHDEGFKSLYMPSGVSFKGVLLSTVAPKVSYDIMDTSQIYRSELAKAVGTTAYRLKSILAPDELKEMLLKAKSENFSTGNNFENVLNGKFRINLHVHLNSDGTMSARELLDQSARYADYRKTVLHKEDPVVIGITDHDMLEGAKEAVRIIANNPEKYKNIRVMLGIEFNTHDASRQFEAIGYCINPFDKGLNGFLESRRQINREYLESFLRSEVNKWEASAGIPPEKRLTMVAVANHAKQRNVDGEKHIRYFGSPGLMYGFTNALKSIFHERGWGFAGIDEFSRKHGLQYKSFAINPATPALEEITKAIQFSDSGFVGIAHPCRNFGGVDLRLQFAKFKALGVEAVEAHYQYPTQDGRFPKSFQEHVDLAATQAGLLKSGGQDNHRNNLFTQAADLEALPLKVQEIIKPKPSSYRVSDKYQEPQPEWAN